MGCDIHLHQEVKINGTWHHYGCPEVDRHYRLFTKLANVRNNPAVEIQPISEPRGLPEDATELTRFDAGNWGTVGHSHSWISADEILTLENTQGEWRYPAEDVPDYQKWGLIDLFDYLFGNTWPGFMKYPGDRPDGLEDVRFVFWFDN